jgi:Mrr N-terminal domain
MPTIRIDEQVYEWLQSQGRPFEDTPNSVLRRIANLEGEAETSPRVGRSVPEVGRGRGEKTPQQDFREPLLQVLKRHGGEVRRLQGLREVEDILSDRLTDYDKAEISSGTIRWEKSAEWEVRAMRMEGLLKPVHESAWGVWALSDKGREAASRLPGADPPPKKKLNRSVLRGRPLRDEKVSR